MGGAKPPKLWESPFCRRREKGPPQGGGPQGGPPLLKGPHAFVGKKGVFTPPCCEYGAKRSPQGATKQRQEEKYTSVGKRPPFINLV